MKNVIRLHKEPAGNPDSGDPGIEFNQSSIRFIASNPRIPKEYISAEELYPANDFNYVLSSAIKLLSEGIEHIGEAILTLRDGDLILSDDAVQRFQALLPELFCCRNIGDGFGTIINALYHAMNHRGTNPFSEKQLSAIRKALLKIHSEPYIGYEESVEEVMSLEAAALEVDPPYFDFIADLLNG
jgi:hypothetical protein